ncbi:MAG: phospho-N-acetylmuramoyl-pentapeptide-transferase [Anaerolineales bacterium]|nr:phospho-N-acetylmuramoyl-pentapeptide-transferase [Anaerolineales bacterium]
MTQTSMALALAGFSFMVTVIWGTPLLRVLRYFKVGKTIRVDGPERHFSKLGTPTMGGILIVLPVVLITLLLNASNLVGVTVMGRSVILPMGVMVLYAILGAVDDWAGLRGKRRGEGMRARTKFLIQLALAVATVLALRLLLKSPDMYLPGFNREIELGLWYFFFAPLVIVTMSNAVNLTDGLDGLAGLISATAFATYGGVALFQGQAFLARFCFTVVGAIFGFLWFNVHPAQMFMGDTGSLSLGAVLGVAGLMTGQWPLLAVIAIIPMSTMLSVVLQVAYFKLTGGKRLFKMAPLHHHFELSGWSETQVVQRFWLISLLFAMIGVALAVV